MSEDKVVTEISPANVVRDHLTDFLRESANKMLQMAIEAEVNDFIANFANEINDSGQKRVVRNGYLPEREVKTGIGSMAVKMPRVRDRGNQEEKAKFTSNLIPKYMRRSVTLDLMLPLLYLKGISTNDFVDVLQPMLGDASESITPAVIAKLKDGWYDEYQAWQKRDLSRKHYVYFWADGVYLQARGEDDKNCMLVIVAANKDGKKELVALIDGYRESKQSWKDLLSQLKEQGLAKFPNLAVGDGALGLWGALNEEFPETKHQRCWVHKTCNVLDKLPKSQHCTAKTKLHNIYMAATKADALSAVKDFTSYFATKYPKATECLVKDQDALLNFYSFPAQHWPHIRTTNPIESTFATVKHRTRKSRGCFSNRTIVASVFKLMLEAEKRWKKLYGHKKLTDVINLVEFVDGVDKSTTKQVQNDSEAA